MLSAEHSYLIVWYIKNWVGQIPHACIHYAIGSTHSQPYFLQNVNIILAKKQLIVALLQID